MGSAALILTLCLAAAPAEEKGTVRGEVRVTTPGPDGRPVPKEDRSGVVVYLTGYTEPPPEEVARMSQRDKKFLPAVLPIVAGQKVEFLNEDGVVHNVFSRSRAMNFDAGKSRTGERYTQSFRKTGIVDVYCDIHERMQAAVVVVPNRAFAITDAQGRFVLRGVPPGKHPLFAVLRRGEHSDSARTEVLVVAGQEAQVVLELNEAPREEGHLDKRGREYTDRPDGY